MGQNGINVSGSCTMPASCVPKPSQRVQNANVKPGLERNLAVHLPLPIHLLNSQYLKYVL